MPKTQRLRIIVKDVGLYLNLDQVSDVLCMELQYKAVRACLDKIEEKTMRGQPCRGFAAEFNGIFVQIDLVD